MRYFVAVAECGSFTAASRQLGVAQPALSRHVKSLETDLGITLFVRSASGVALTREGGDLLRHGRRALDELEQIPKLLAQGGAPLSGRVAIGLPTSTSAVLSKPTLLAVTERHPAVRLHLVESLSGFLSEWIESGRLDLAVLFDVETQPHLHVEPLLIEDLWLVGRPDAFPAREAEIPIRSLGRYPLLLPSVSHSHRSLLGKMTLSHGVQLNVVAEVDSLAVLKAIVSSEPLFSIFAQSAVHAEVAAGKLHAARLVEPVISRSVSLVASTARGRSRAAREVGTLVADLARDLVIAGTWQGRLPSAAGS
ncbi:LysR family transcriptional regulator [Enterovirga sp. CN4-39]|uniref:LysR family transcriptional regulator n=1 Tax=Enterovirga sp. CN4-39 TaxID=3400910 RepID=UPI003C2CA2C9